MRLPFVRFPAPAEGSQGGGPDLSMYETLIGTLQQQMAQEQGAQAPPGMEQPGQTNPLAAMGATFAASMADQLTGTQQNLGDVQGQLTQQRQTALGVDLQNIRDERAFSLDKRKNMLTLMEKMNDMKLARADAASDFKEANEAARAALEIEKLKREWSIEDMEAKHGFSMEEIAERGRWSIKGREATAAGESVSPVSADNAVLRFQENIESILSRKDAWDTVYGKWPLGNNPKVLTDETKQAVLDRAVTAARNTTMPQVRDTALESIVKYVLVDENGQFPTKDGKYDLSSRGMKEFNSLLNQLFEDGGEAWLTSRGL